MTVQQPIEAPRTRAVKSEPSRVKRLFKVLGPGLITGASDDDPSGIATYSQTGAQFGYSFLWTALFTYPLMAAVQYICAKVGLVSGNTLCAVLRKHYPRRILYAAVLLLFIANTINAGADLGAIGAGINLLVPAIPIEVSVVPVTMLLVALMIMGSYERIVSIFKWLTLSLFCYIGAALCTHPDWHAVLRSTLTPSITWSKDYIAVIVAVLGTTISPYLFFWQSIQEVEEQRKAGRSIAERRGATKDDLKYAAIDVNAGMLFSNVVMYFIIFGTAATLHVAGKTHIDSARDAALALRPIAGELAYALFACGIIGTGILAVPILVGSSAHALATAFGWRRGLDEKWWRAKEYYGVIAIASILGMAMNFLHINPMSALFWTAVLNGVLAPPLLVLIMLITNNKEVMGDKTNSPLINAAGWLATAVMTLAAVALIVTSWPH